MAPVQSSQSQSSSRKVYLPDLALKSGFRACRIIRNSCLEIRFDAWQGKTQNFDGSNADFSISKRNTVDDAVSPQKYAPLAWIPSRSCSDQIWLVKTDISQRASKLEIRASKLANYEARLEMLDLRIKNISIALAVLLDCC